MRVVNVNDAISHQICPFPYDLFVEQVQKYSSAEVVWAQEEHKNQGWWSYVQPRIASVMDRPLTWVILMQIFIYCLL